jgi:hypothetical protein
MQVASAGFSAAYFASPSGRVFAWGGTFALAAFVFGMAVARPIGVRMGRLAAMPAPAAPEDQAARAAERATLQRRAATAGAINILLLLGAALAMATARYM